jgi:hypothetical protein
LLLEILLWLFFFFYFFFLSSFIFSFLNSIYLALYSRSIHDLDNIKSFCWFFSCHLDFILT